MRRGFPLALILLTLVLPARAQFDNLTLSGAISTYYSYSLNKPPDHIRAFCTQPSRNEQFSVDLALVSLDWHTPFMSIRAGLQAGTWAEANYVGDDYAWRFVHEAVVEFNVDSTWWVKAGIGPSNIGHESSVNAENMLLSRSLIADATPYFLTGGAVAYTPSDDVRIAVLAVNGWQKIVDNNNDLSFGTKVDWQVGDASALCWGTYVGNDEDTDSAARMRLHSDIWWDHSFSDALRLVLVFDVGLLENDTRDAYNLATYGGAKLGWRFSDMFRLGGRLEYLNDPDNVLVASNAPFQTFSSSIGLDVFPVEHIIVRVESRSMHSNAAVYPSNDGYKTDDLYFTVALVGQF